MKAENRGLLQRAALLESLSAEAEALRQQVRPSIESRLSTLPRRFMSSCSSRDLSQKPGMLQVC